MNRVDERDTMFARRNYKKDTQAYNDYYSKNPDKKNIDDSIRSRPMICTEGGMNYNELNSTIVNTAFDFLDNISHLCEQQPKCEKVQVNKKVITKRLKGLAKHYGAKLVGITKLEDYHYYTHRGRHEKDYGQEIKTKHKYGIVFACEMNRDMINRGPMISEVIETSKVYVDCGIIGMILATYISNLGYESRNHMDANYLLMPVRVAKDAGLGQIGRSTMLITKEYGSRVRLGVVTTDLELEEDDEVDFGLEDFCIVCNKCAHICPSQSLSNKPQKSTWSINQETCFTKWLYMGTDCGLCIAVCPFSQELESVKNIDTFKKNGENIKKVLEEYKKRYGKRPFVVGNPEWLR